MSTARRGERCGSCAGPGRAARFSLAPPPASSPPPSATARRSCLASTRRRQRYAPAHSRRPAHSHRLRALAPRAEHLAREKLVRCGCGSASLLACQRRQPPSEKQHGRRSKWGSRCSPPPLPAQPTPELQWGSRWQLQHPAKTVVQSGRGSLTRGCGGYARGQGKLALHSRSATRQHPRPTSTTGKLSRLLSSTHGRPRQGKTRQDSSQARRRGPKLLLN